MTSRPVLRYLCLRWLTWVGQLLERRDRILEALMNAYLLVAAGVFASRAYETIRLTVPDRGVRLTIVVGSYR